MATTRGVPAEPLRRQPDERSTSAHSQATPSQADGSQATSEQLRNQVIARASASAALGCWLAGWFTSSTTP